MVGKPKRSGRTSSVVNELETTPGQVNRASTSTERTKLYRLKNPALAKAKDDKANLAQKNKSKQYPEEHRAKLDQLNLRRQIKKSGGATAHAQIKDIKVAAPPSCCACRGESCNFDYFGTITKKVPCKCIRNQQLCTNCKCKVCLNRLANLRQQQNFTQQEIHGDRGPYGLFCTKSIKRSWPLGVFDGERHTSKHYGTLPDFEKRRVLSIPGRLPLLVPGLTSNINHSCDPSTIIHEFYDKSTNHSHAVIFCVDCMIPGEEITFDYGDKYHKDQCLCGTPN